MKLAACGFWGKKLAFLAKIGAMSGTIVLVNRTRDFSVGQRIKYCDTSATKGTSIGTTPKWSVGKIWKIDCNRLYLERM